MKTAVCMWILTGCLALTGCSERLPSYKGATVTQLNYIIALQQGGQQEGTWKTNELSLEYRCRTLPGALNISGTVTLVGGFRIGFNAIDRLVVQLLFLDDRGVVIDNVVVYSAEYRRSVDMTPMKYDKTVPMPPECRAISFTYDGKLTGGDASVEIGYFPS